MTPLAIVDAIGVFVFALSGGLAANRQRMDFFGMAVVALLPAIGGGTLRDLLLDRPVFWLSEPHIILIAVSASPVSWLLGERIARFKTLLWLDALGLALFTVAGASIAYNAGYGAVVTVMMGTITASFGGLLRDIVCNEIPLILREDIYATAALIGALTFFGAARLGLPSPLTLLSGGAVAFGIRAAVIFLKDIRPRKTRDQI